MTDQSPEQVEPVDEPAVEPEKTTNDVTQQDDVEVDEDQDPVAQEDLGHTFEPDPDDVVFSGDGIEIRGDGTLTADNVVTTRALDGGDQ